MPEPGAPLPTGRQTRPGAEESAQGRHEPPVCTTTGYGAWWRRYADAGWAPLPLPHGRKEPPPTGFTGAGAPMPSQDQYKEWALRRPDANVAVRLPAGVLGVDVDDYAGKQGGRTIAALEERLGQLPPTFFSTSRDDAVSGIRFYAVPQGVNWRGRVSTEHRDGSMTADVDLIHTGYRYAAVAPSVHPSGRRYRWFNPAGSPVDQLPAVDDLPRLPANWVQALTINDRLPGPGRQERPAPPSLTWSGLLPDEEPCVVVAQALRAAVTELEEEGRHQAILRNTIKLLRLASVGHRGVGRALGSLEECFLDEATDRSEDEARAEWSRALAGAAGLVGAPRQELMCGCTRDLFERAVRGSVGFSKGVAGISERELLRQMLTWSRGTWTVRCSQRQLGEAIGKKQPYVCRVLARLRRMGWVAPEGDRHFGEGAGYRLAVPAVIALSAQGSAAGASADNSLTVARHRLFGFTGLGRGPAETWAALPVVGLRLNRKLIGVPTRPAAAKDRPGDVPAGRRASHLDFRPGTGARIKDVVAATGKSDSTVYRHLKILQRQLLAVRDSTGTWWRLSFEPERVADELGVSDRTPMLKEANKRDRLLYYGRWAQAEQAPGPERLRTIVTEDEDLIVDTSTGVVLERAASPEELRLLRAISPDAEVPGSASSN